MCHPDRIYNHLYKAVVKIPLRSYPKKLILAEILTDSNNLKINLRKKNKIY